MRINRIGAGYPAWYGTKKTQINNSGTGFADWISGADMAGSVPSQKASVRTEGQNSTLEAYQGSTQCKACL